jgi:hypothetical protein
MKSNLKTCFGINSSCDDGKHVLFFDYDIKNLNVVCSELEYIQKLFNLSEIYIIFTDNGFNAFCFDKFLFKDVLVIYSKCEIICEDFVKYCTKRGYFTLRMSKDKELVWIIKSNSCIHKKSNAHRIFFRDVMKYHFNDSDNFDNSKNIILESYSSNKHGYDLNV